MNDSFGSLTTFGGLAAGSLIFGQGWILAGAVALAGLSALVIRLNWRREKGLGDC